MMSSKAIGLSRNIITPGQLVLLGLMGLGFAVAIGRYISGIGAISNLGDSAPLGALDRLRPAVRGGPGSRRLRYGFSRLHSG